MKFLTFDEIFLTAIILTKHLVSIKSYNECYAWIVSTRAQHERRQGRSAIFVLVRICCEHLRCSVGKK